MPDIKITSADPNSTDDKLVFVFSATPKPDLIEEFNQAWQKNQKLANSGINHSINGTKLSLSGKCTDPQTILDELKKIIAEVNQQQDDFQTKLKNLKF